MCCRTPVGVGLSGIAVKAYFLLRWEAVHHTEFSDSVTKFCRIEPVMTTYGMCQDVSIELDPACVCVLPVVFWWHPLDTSHSDVSL